jgi:hypothetical protein
MTKLRNVLALAAIAFAFTVSTTQSVRAQRPDSRGLRPDAIGYELLLSEQPTRNAKYQYEKAAQDIGRVFPGGLRHGAVDLRFKIKSVDPNVTLEQAGPTMAAMPRVPAAPAKRQLGRSYSAAKTDRRLKGASHGKASQCSGVCCGGFGVHVGSANVRVRSSNP